MKMVSAIKHPAIQAAEQFPRWCPCHFMWQWLTAKWIPHRSVCAPHTLFHLQLHPVSAGMRNRTSTGTHCGEAGTGPEPCPHPTTLLAHRRGVLCAWQHQNKILPLPPPSRKCDCTWSKTGELSVRVCAWVMFPSLPGTVPRSEPE